MDKERIKEEIVNLRDKLASAEVQANTIIGLLPTKYGLPCKVLWHLKESDNELCKIARKMGLDKVGLVEPLVWNGNGWSRREKANAKSL